jgi:hypothetical protein
LFAASVRARRKPPIGHAQPSGMMIRQRRKNCGVRAPSGYEPIERRAVDEFAKSGDTDNAAGPGVDNDIV